MATNTIKELVWSIKKGLLCVSADQIFQVATALPPLPPQDPAKLDMDEWMSVLTMFAHICLPQPYLS